ncbi:MAG: TfuA-related McrA-glycine thioamidation protein [Methanothrix sp.]|nr:TfuA-related McrA-glycine thioamidation protein [Methanothrix sp.]
MQGIVVFLGPSLPRDRAIEILEAEYRPPARRGDIYRAARDGARVICLIDGVFFQDCSVAHKEILAAIEMGSKVIGASSMGALRAAELDVYGMEGVGEIYRAYRSGELVSDDEVALIFDPVTMEPLSEPLVNIRLNLDLALQRRIIDSASHDILLSLARSLYFPERTYERMLEAAAGRIPQGLLDSLSRFLQEERRDLKMEDAAAALRRAGEIANEG